MNIVDLLKVLGERPIAYQRIYAKVSGSVTAGLLMSQFMYWSTRTNDPDGWFYKTQVQITEETEMSRSETESARKRLRNLGLIEEKRKGNPARMYYRVNADRLANLIAGNLQTGMQESRELDCDNSANSTRRDYTETTAETSETDAGASDSTEPDKGTGSTKAINARRAEYWRAYVKARQLPDAAERVDRARGFADLKRAFPDMESFTSVPLDQFVRATIAYAARSKPEFVTVAKVIASMAPKLDAPTAEPPDVGTHLNYYAARLERSSVMLIGEEKERMRIEIEKLVTRHPDLEPKHIVWATTWGWRRDGKCPTSERIGWTVEQWIKAGRPETRMGDNRGRS